MLWSETNAETALRLVTVPEKPAVAQVTLFSRLYKGCTVPTAWAYTISENHMSHAPSPPLVLLPIRIVLTVLPAQGVKSTRRQCHWLLMPSFSNGCPSVSWAPTVMVPSVKTIAAPPLATLCYSLNYR